MMTCPVVVVHTEETFASMANLLRRHRISGLPVVDDDERLVGVVSESDLLRRLLREEVRRLFADQAPIRPSGRESRATAETAGGLMSRPAISTTPGASADEALQLMRRRAVRRLPVIDGERRVVGIVTRTDLLHPYARTDEDLLDELCDEVLPRLGVVPGQIRLGVEDGNVLMGGTLADSQLVERVEEAIRDTPGVVSVESRLRALQHTPAQGNL
jgi:CBS domain-containing protein